jgi:hypothetical protein
MRSSPGVGRLALALVVLVPSIGAAQGIEGSVRVERIASGLTSPMLVLSPAGDHERLFVVEQYGPVKILEDGAVLPTPFLDLTGKVAGGGEQGLLGMAFHPDFAVNGFFYVCYTRTDGSSVLERYTVSATDPDVADVASAVTLLGPVAQPGPWHNGGCLQFGFDGKLYVAMGDGGGANDSGPGHLPGGNAQSTATLLGKLLRLDVDLPFPHVPPDNPYAGQIGPLGPIWASGLREPWRFSFDRATGDLYLGDVGQASREEIDFVPAAAMPTSDAPLNFGWRCREGTLCTGLSGCPCDDRSLVEPIEEFDHSVGCAVIGGHVYRGCAIPELRGHYVYSSFCYASPSRIFAFDASGLATGSPRGPTIELTAALAPDAPLSITALTSFGEDAAGELYLCDRDGEVYKLVPEDLADCNGNGVPDACEIGNGTVHDTNHNGVPDGCEGLAVPREERRAGLRRKIP